MPAKRSRKPKNTLAREMAELRARVNELEETFLAIQHGKVDAVVVNGPNGEKVFTLQGAEHPYRILVENMNEGAATLDTQGVVLYANASFATILDVSLEKVIGAALAIQFGPEEQQQLTALIEKALNGSARGEINIKTHDGQSKLVRLSLSLVADFEIRTICVVATDLTEISGTAEALKSSEDALRNLSGRLLRLQDEERRRISRDLHDITGQKLALLSMNISRILNSKKPGKSSESQKLLEEAITLANESNQEIRTLSYVLHPPLLDELGLSCAVQWFAQGFETRAGIKVSVDIPSDLVRLSPDAEVALFRVVQESLTNVHRYSESPTAWVRAHAEAGEVILEIGDAGKGFSEESKVHVVGPMPTLGVGIQGMKERVRQLSGRLQITSQPGKGTLVRATLPIAAQPAEVHAIFEHGNEVVRSNGHGSHDVPGSRKRILIADDHEVLRRGIRTMLECEPGLEICGEAVDGKDAIEKTLAQNPDLLILDINMPVFNGLEVVRQLVRHKLKTKILVLSVHESDQIAEEVFIAGAQRCLSKSTAADKLVNEVTALLSENLQIQTA